MKVQSVIRGTISAEARITIVALRCDGAIIENVPTALATFDPRTLADHVIVPVGQTRKNVILMQQTAREWDRYLSSRSNGTAVSFARPIVLSCRDRWNMENGIVELFDRAVVIDGAKRLEAALMLSHIPEVPAIVLFGLDDKRELALRRDLEADMAISTQIEVIERFGTTAPRLVIAVNWTNIEVLSDPFVLTTSLGYAPAILVRRQEEQKLEHILVGAKSIALELEALRIKRGTLIGTHLSVRKQDNTRTARYLIRVKDRPAT